MPIQFIEIFIVKFTAEYVSALEPYVHDAIAPKVELNTMFKFAITFYMVITLPGPSRIPIIIPALFIAISEKVPLLFVQIFIVIIFILRMKTLSTHFWNTSRL